MIVIRFRGYAVSRCKTVVLRNPLPPHKKEQRNTVATLTSFWHRSACRKNSAKSCPTRLVQGWEDSTGIRPRNGQAVTTSHLFSPNDPRRPMSSLRFWLPNLGSTVREIVAPSVHWPNIDPSTSAPALCERGAGGVSRADSGRVPKRVSARGILITKADLPRLYEHQDK